MGHDHAGGAFRQCPLASPDVAFLLFFTDHRCRCVNPRGPLPAHHGRTIAAPGFVRVTAAAILRRHLA
eukprot:12430927-Heterocapsa_arctica.AAC.1